MARRRAIFALLVAAEQLALSTRDASAAGATRTPQTPPRRRARSDGARRVPDLADPLRT